jgi:hypothetical protein
MSAFAAHVRDTCASLKAHYSKLKKCAVAAVSCRNGVWLGEFLQSLDVRCLCQEVTLDGPDAQPAFDDYISEVCYFV